MGTDKKVILHLVPLDPDALAACFTALTGEPMSPEGLARLRRIVEPEPDPAGRGPIAGP